MQKSVRGIDDFLVRRREAEMARTISIGNQSFEEIREKGYFLVDKTNLIKEWWESADSVTLITRPRRLKDHKYGHAELLLFESLSGQRRFV